MIEGIQKDFDESLRLKLEFLQKKQEQTIQHVNSILADLDVESEDYKIIRENYEEIKERYAELEQKIIEQLKEANDSDIAILSRHETKASFSNISKIIQDIREDYDHIDKNEGYVTGLPTGFYDLDYKIRGLQKGKLILLAGRKWMGKLGLALGITYHVIAKEKKATAFFSLSQSNAQIIKFLLSIDSDLVGESMLRGFFKNSKQKEDFEKSARKLEETPLYLDDTSDITVEEIRKKCMKLKSEKELSLVVIDYLELLRNDKMCGTGVGKYWISKELRNLAKELDCPILVISELSSEGEKKWNERPELSELIELDYTKQFADVIMLLYSDINDSGDNYGRKEVELIIAKNRDGAIGKVRLISECGNRRFKNLSY